MSQNTGKPYEKLTRRVFEALLAQQSVTNARGATSVCRKTDACCIRFDDGLDGEEEADLPASLRRAFATTNAIENMNGSLRPIARNVKRWKDRKMIRRWVALGIAEAQKGFRRVKSYVNMPSLVSSHSTHHRDGVA